MNTAARHVATDLLAEVELLVLFSPAMQSGGHQKPPHSAMDTSAHCWMVARVYGRPGYSDLSRKPVVEDMRVEDGDGNDIEPLLSEAMVNEIADYVLKI